jgi:protein TonB
VVQGGNNTARKLDVGVRRRTKRFVPVELPPEESVFDRSMLIGLILALLVGTPLTIAMLREVNILPPPQEETTVEVSIVEPPPEPEPEPDPPEVVEYKKPVRVPVAPANPEPELPPRRFELTLESTVSKNSSGMSVAVGKAPSSAPGSASGDPDLDAPAKVSYSRLEVAPTLKREFKAPYPETARREGIEGTVVMKLTIDERGRVTKVRIVRGINDELDAVTRSAARKLLFRPGMVDGKPVITTGYVMRYTWELND